MLTGERPFKGRNVTEVSYRLMNEPAPDIRLKVETISPAVATVIDRALAKQPADRFASAEDMAAALRGVAQPPPLLDDPTVVLPPPSGHAPVVTEATLTTIERKLAQHVGPMARHLVQNAARRTGSLDELCETLGRLIERPEHRAQFRSDVLASQVGTAAPQAADIAPAEVRRAEQALARHVGPIARVLVKRALAAAGSPDDLWAALATHIGSEADRQAFLRSRG